ncbi:hypothetical protein VTI74DRAFT_9099 [Chaetomium olivicolor]
MSQPINTTLQLSGEGQPSTSTSYSLQQYLNSPKEVTDRLLKEFSVGDVVGRVQAVRDEVQRLGDVIIQPAQSSD